MRNLKQISILCLCLFILSIAFTTNVFANYPNKPIKMVIAGKAGSGLDLFARQLVPLLKKELGEEIVIINSSTGNLAVNKIIKARPDGYTIGLLGSPALSTAYFYGNANYDYDDLNIIIETHGPNFGFYTNVTKDWNSFLDVVETAKKENRPITVGTFNIDMKLTLYTLEDASGIKFAIIPQTSGAAMIPAVLGDHIELAIVPEVYSDTVKAGKTKMLGGLGEKRFAQLPDIPTVAEQGFDFMQLNNSTFLVAPQKTPEEALNRLEAAFIKIKETDEFKKIVETSSSTPALTKTRAEAQAVVKARYEEIKKMKEKSQ